jgi:hypothetical protein
MDHANSLVCGSGAMDVAAGRFAGFADPTCSIKTYGDNLDLMGISHWDMMPQISASFWEMGRFGKGNEITNLGTVTGARSVTLRPWAGDAANRAVKFTDPKSGEVYYLELRTPVGYDSVIAQAGNRGVKITQQGGGNSSILLPPNTRGSAFNGYYSNTQAWQAGQTFTSPRRHEGAHRFRQQHRGHRDHPPAGGARQRLRRIDDHQPVRHESHPERQRLGLRLRQVLRIIRGPHLPDTAGRYRDGLRRDG